MAQPHEVGVRLTVKGGAPTSGTAKVLARSRGERAVRAMKGAGLCLLALPLVVIPPHFPWLLGALTAALVMGIVRWRDADSLLELDAPCPSCMSMRKVISSAISSANPSGHRHEDGSDQA